MKFKQVNFLYFAGVMISNTLLYAIIVRFALFHIGDGLTNANVLMVLTAQLLGWFALKLWQLRDDDNQWLRESHFVIGGVLVMAAGLGYAYVQAWPSLFEVMLFAVGHILIQKGFWTQLTTVSSDDKVQLDVRVILILFFLFLNFLNDIHDPKPLMICGILGAGHVLVRVLVTGVSQLWLIYNEDVQYKSHYHALVKTFQFNHAVSSSGQGMRKSLMDMGLFVVGVAAGGATLIWFKNLEIVKRLYGQLVDGLMAVLYFLFGDLMDQFYKYLLSNAAKMKPAEQKPKAGDVDLLLNSPQAQAVAARQEEAQMMLGTILGVIVVIILMLILWAMARKKTASIKKRLDYKVSSGERLIPEDSWWRSAMDQWFRKKGKNELVSDEFRKKYKKLILQMKRAGLQVTLKDTPEELQKKIIRLLPEGQASAELVTLVYNELRYGDQRHPRYTEALKALEHLKQLTKKEAIKYGKTT